MDAASAPADAGYLVVNVRTAGGALPFEGALVTVYAGNLPVAQVVTDRMGVSPRLTLPTPPKSNSLRPGGQTPYAEYTVVTEAAGYYPVTDLRLPIYPGVTSIQPVELIPRMAGPQDDGGAPPDFSQQFDESRAPEL